MLHKKLVSLRIYLYGSLRVESAEGDDHTPNAEKTRALVALLATSPKGERSRQWLQAKLWSDRAPEQAAASLRQALVQLRRALGDAKDVLIADRRRVTLDLSRIDLAAPSDGQEFLEGIDARDSEFESWLTAERVRRCSDAPVPTRSACGVIGGTSVDGWTVAIDANGEGAAANWLACLVGDAIARHVRDFFSARVLMGNTATNPNLWVVKIRSFQADDACLGLRASLEHPASGQHIWAEHRHLVLKGAPPIEHPDVLRLVNELVEALGDTLILIGDGGPDDPDRLCRGAIRALFSMDPRSVSKADEMFAKACEMRERGLYLAWRAQIRAIQHVERHRVDAEHLREEGAYFCARALEAEPNNSMVLATVANTCGHLLGEQDRSLALAKRSVLLNRANPMAWWALSSANVYSGDIQESYAVARNARQLALLSPHRFWWDNQLFGAAVVLGRIGEAQRLAEVARAQNPRFRPPLRYLVAFYANTGREEDALDVAETLSSLEPDFSVDRLVMDRSYPASLLHRAPGLDLDQVNALA